MKPLAFLKRWAEARRCARIRQNLPLSHRHVVLRSYQQNVMPLWKGIDGRYHKPIYVTEWEEPEDVAQRIERIHEQERLAVESGWVELE